MTDAQDGAHGAEHVIKDLSDGAQALLEAIKSADMGQVTWYALALAERAQDWSHRAISIDDDTEQRRFFSLTGLLVDVAGNALQADAARFPYVAKAFAHGGPGSTSVVAPSAEDAATGAHLMFPLLQQADEYGIAVQEIEAAFAAHDRHVTTAAADLAGYWSELQGETRAALLLSTAWQAADHGLIRASGGGSLYADDVHRHAREFITEHGIDESSSTAFHGPEFPTRLPRHPAATLANSVGHDRSDIENSLTAFLILFEAATRDGESPRHDAEGK
ncbi:hypothetical protein [Streptomyces goshikiensis]|uniref:hypothetical protein n=1 Tax=Streptomyces goshikiensis TaxID=1942 RepID=UPI0036BD47FC